jgi:hypothetical protein
MEYIMSFGEVEEKTTPEEKVVTSNKIEVLKLFIKVFLL